MAPQPPPAPAPELPPSEFETGARREVELASLPAVVTLPDAPGWRATRGGTFVVLEHPASESMLVFRLWRAARLVRPSECEAEARLARPSLPRMDAGSAVERRVLDAPTGFDVRLVVGAEPGQHASVRGVALAVGAGVGRCYLAAFETHADGRFAAERVADRLGIVVSGVFETIRLEGADERVSPAAPSPPAWVK